MAILCQAYPVSSGDFNEIMSFHLVSRLPRSQKGVVWCDLTAQWVVTERLVTAAFRGFGYRMEQKYLCGLKVVVPGLASFI